MQLSLESLVSKKLQVHVTVLKEPSKTKKLWICISQPNITAMMEVWKGGQSHMLLIFLANKKEFTTKLEISCLSASDHDLITFVMGKERIVYTVITHTEL